MIKNNFDIGDFVDVLTPQKAVIELIKRIKKRRKEANLTQAQLAIKSGVSYAAIKRLEGKGEIALSSLIAICYALGNLDDINRLFETPIITSVRDYKPDCKY